jgi:hypothetical protein
MVRDPGQASGPGANVPDGERFPRPSSARGESMSDSKDSETAMGIQAAAKIGSRDWTVTAVLPTGPGPWSFEVAPELGRDETNGLNIWDAAQDLLAKFSDQSIDRDMPSLFADAGLPPLTLKCVRGRSLKDPGTIVLQTELDLQTGLVSTLQLMFTVARVVKSKSADGPAATDAGAKPEFSVIAGVTTKGAISLGNANDADPVKRLLGQVSIDRLGVFYAGDDASEVPLFEDEATRRFQKGLSISAQFGRPGRGRVAVAIRPHV